MRVRGEGGNAIETEPGRSRKPRMWAEWALAAQHCWAESLAKRSLELLAKVQQVLSCLGPRVFPKSLIQQRGLRERDADVQLFLFNWSNKKEPEILLCSSCQKAVAIFIAKAEGIFGSNLCVCRKRCWNEVNLTNIIKKMSKHKGEDLKENEIVALEILYKKIR